MLKTILFVFFAKLFFKLQATAIAFVHLGETVPSCIFVTIKQARHLNPEQDIYLLTDHEGYISCSQEGRDFFEREHLHLVDMSQIPCSFLHKKFHEVNAMVDIANAKYWTYTSQRFFVLYDFLEEKGLREVIHLENDCMLYVDIEELLPIFRKQEVFLAAPFTSLKGCIPCFMFIRQARDLTFLLEHILDSMEEFKGENPSIVVNDMATLASFYRKKGDGYLQPLPTLMQTYPKRCLQRKSLFFQDNRTSIDFLFKYASTYDPYLFDAATLGIYIGGSGDSRGPGSIYWRSLFNPKDFSFYWGMDKEGKNVPYLSFAGVDYRVVNLHFYCKKPQQHASFSLPLGNFPIGR